MPAHTPARSVLLALSGGVDSAVCAEVLRRQGYTVRAAVIRFSAAHGPAVQAARQAAQELDIPLDVLDAEELFERQVAAPFCAAYAAGYTPNPCVVCNPLVKFHVLAQAARALGIPHIASGHYARVVKQGEIFHVACAVSIQRDQSYMLYRLPQSVLSCLLLPLGEYQKPQVRSLAEQLGLSSATLPDSQEICFIPEGDHAAYVEARCGPGLKGHFLGPKGEDLGPHRGVVCYTVGQRRGLGLALGQPVFVRKILPNGNILLGYAGEEFENSIALEDMLTPNGLPLNPALPYQVKIRSTAAPAPCRVLHSTPKTARLLFNSPQRAAAPGQSAVLYRNGVVMGGGFICQAPEVESP